MTPPATIEAVSAAWHYECDRWRLRVTNHAFNFVRDRDPDGPISVDTFELRGSGDENAFAAMRDAACAQAACTAHLSALQAQGMVIVPRTLLEMVAKGYHRSDEEDDWQQCLVCSNWIDHYGHSSTCELNNLITAATPTP